MKNKISKILISSLIILSIITGCNNNSKDINIIDKNGYYTSKEDVSEYIIEYDELPENYITKDEAKELGWEAEIGNLWLVTDKKSIGGDIFYNREKQLPDKKGRIWYECDIDYEGGKRNSKRIVFSNDGIIYYTGDHYNTFELIYGGDK